MRVPQFIREIGEQPYRRKIFWSLRTTYILVLFFLIVAFFIDRLKITTLGWVLYTAVLVKLAVNTMAWVCTRRRRAVLIANGLNLTTDLLAMTAAIYFTGGQLSPLFALYIIEITGIALLANLGITLLVSITALCLYGAMAVLIRTGTLPQYPPFMALTPGGHLTWGYLVLDGAMLALFLGIVTYFTASTLRLLRDRERKLEAKTVELMEAGRLKSQFMANITHELRTPIHGTLGLASLLDDGVYGPVTAKQKEALEGITRSAENLLKLIDELLDLARAEAGRMEVKKAAVDVNEVVRGVAAAARWMMGKKSLDLAVEVPPGLPDPVTDRGKLVQILVNLLSNAIKFTPEGGRIRVRAETAGPGHICISVADTGIGIDARDIPHIFEEFRQVDGSSSRQYGGVGLGLSVVKRLTDLLGGEIRVESAPGRGSTFTLRIPVKSTD